MSATTETFDFERAYRVDGYRGVAWRALRHVADTVEVETECNGSFYYDVEDVENVSRVVCRMVGDDRDFDFDVDELTPIGDDDYCAGCGQIGCGWC